MNVNYVKFSRKCNRMPNTKCTRRTVQRTFNCKYGFFSATRKCKGRLCCPKRGRRVIKHTIENFHGRIIVTAGLRVQPRTIRSYNSICTTIHHRLRHSLGGLRVSCISLCCLRHVGVRISGLRITRTVNELVRRKLIHR